jgi:MFS family permease
MMRLAADWFPSKYFTIATGCGFVVGVLGGSAAGAPLVRLLGEHGWRPVMFSLAIVGVLLSILIWWCVRDKPSGMGFENYGKKPSAGRPLLSFFQSIRTVFSYRNSLLLMFVPGALSGSVNTFCGLWGNQFLTSQYDMTISSAALVCTAVLIVWSFSAPLWGMMSEKMARRKPLFMATCSIVAISWSTLLLFPNLPLTIVIVLLLFAGFGAGGLPISYAFAKESVPHYLAGTAGGLNNGSSIFGTVLMQPLIGIILDRHAIHGANGELIYQFSGFQYGFGLFVIWSLLSVLFISRLQETYCRQQD